MVSTPSLLDRTEVVHLAGGRREYLVPGAAEQIAEREAHKAAFDALTLETERTEAVAAKVRKVIEAGPPGTDGDVLERHLAAPLWRASITCLKSWPFHSVEQPWGYVRAI
jgi:hypothetical protein